MGSPQIYDFWGERRLLAPNAVKQRSLRSAYRRDRIPLLYLWYRVFVLLLGLPQSSWLCGKSGGIGRFNDDVVIG